MEKKKEDALGHQWIVQDARDPRGIKRGGGGGGVKGLAITYRLNGHPGAKVSTGRIWAIGQKKNYWVEKKNQTVKKEGLTQKNANRRRSPADIS